MSDEPIPVWAPFLRLLHWRPAQASLGAGLNREARYAVHLRSADAVLLRLAPHLPRCFVGSQRSPLRDLIGQANHRYANAALTLVGLHRPGVAAGAPVWRTAQ